VSSTLPSEVGRALGFRLAVCLEAPPEGYSALSVSKENIQLLERMYAALNRGNITVALDAIDPDVEWRITSDAGPAPATYHGQKAARRALDSMLDVWRDYSDTPLAFIDQGDYVVARIRSQRTGKSSGAEVSGEVAHLWEIRDGKVVRFVAYGQSALALEAAGIDKRRLHDRDSTDHVPNEDQPPVRLRPDLADLIIEIVEGESAGKQIPFTGPLEAGRDPSLSLSFKDDQASRHHARFSFVDTGAVVEDLDSTNGTYVNDQPIHGAQVLRAGDRIRIGLTVLELRTREQVAVQPSAVRPIPEVTVLEADVLQPVPESRLPGAVPAPSVPSFMVEESEPAFVPQQVLGDDEAESDYKALASLVDARVKRQTSIAAFAVLSLAALVVAIFLGAR
jgi:pSer/pThr/pTyr-binding forkhead associated (FHA) protein/ketosteroid isomerase-like protein